MNKLEFLEANLELSISPMDFMQYQKQHQDDYILVDVRNALFLLSRPVSKQLLDIVREQVLLISCFAADSPIKYQ